MKHSAVEKFYNSLASEKIRHKPKYTVTAVMDTLKYFSPDRNEVIATLMKSGQRYLDIGVGEGNLLRYAEKYYREIYGIDISSVRIGHLRGQRRYNKMQLAVQNIEEKTAFRSKFFDVVSMVAVLEHVFDPHKTLDEVSRILKRNGLLYLEVPNIGWLYPRLSLLFGRFSLTSGDPGFDGGHLHYFDIHNLTTLLAQHHFHVTKVTCSGIFSTLRRIYPPLLGGDLIVVARKTTE